MISKTTRKRYYFILLGIVTITLYLYFSGIPDKNNHFTICIFHNITGYPCPSCGTTRGLKYLVHGYFYEALMMNPLAYLTALGGFLSFFWILRDLYYNEETFFKAINKKVPWYVILIMATLTLANWAWNIEKGL